MIPFKQFLEEAKEAPSYKIYCDMDGVLVDFMGGIMKTLKTNQEPTQVEIDYFLSTLEGSSWKWWANLEWQEGGKKLWGLLRKLNTEILSACPNQCKMQPNVKKGKRIWCKNNLKMTDGINITTRRGKVRFVGEKHILIDDFKKNCNEWIAAGGIAILHRDPRRTAKELRDNILGK